MTTETLTNDRALKVPEVAGKRYLNCSLGQVYRLIDAGELKAFRVGRLLRIKESAIADFINSQET